ncbi:aminoacyl-tRNA deacylase [Marinobacter sp.]|uniref:aminoacyl-tRNA deacylase n=1 Tax=Marinobacter sp. TaxID=50741 RepID=UPI003F9C82F6
MPVQQLKEFLEEANVEYMCLTHPPAFTAQELAHHVKIAGDKVVKTVIIELDGKMAMLVMPATWRVRWDSLSRILDTDFVDLADEQEFQDRFPDCEVGAMPPFGNLFGMTVYCAEPLTEQPELAFAAGSHTESLHMKTPDFLNLVQPMVLNRGFIRPGAQKPAWLVKPHHQHGEPSEQQASGMVG